MDMQVLDTADMADILPDLNHYHRIDINQRPTFLLT